MTTKLIELYKKPDRLLKCKVNDGTGHEYSDDSIYSIKLTSSFSNSAFSFGNTICKHIEIEFRNVDDVYFDDERFYVYIGINDGAGYTYTQLGVFFISDVSKDDNKIKIEAYDAMYKLEKKYGFVYPDRTLKPKELLQDILSESLLTLEDESIIDSIFLSEYGDLSIPGFTSEKTIRQVLGCLVGIYGANAMITREGKLRIFTYKTSSVIEFDTNNYFKFEWDGYEHKVSEIDWQNGNETITLGSTTDDTLRMVMDNYLVSNSMFDSLTDQSSWKSKILERGTISQYVGYNMEWQGCPCLDIGDVVSHTDKKGIKRLIPILDYTLTYKGGLKCTMSAKGTSKLLNEYFKTGTIRGDIKRIESEVGELYDTTQTISDKVDDIEKKIGEDTEEYPWKDGFNLVKNSSFNICCRNQINGKKTDSNGIEYKDLKFCELPNWYRVRNLAKMIIASGENDYPVLKEAGKVDGVYYDFDTYGYTMSGRHLRADGAHGMSLGCKYQEQDLYTTINQKIKEGTTIPTGTKIYLSYRVKTYRQEKDYYTDRDYVDEIDCEVVPGHVTPDYFLESNSSFDPTIEERYYGSLGADEIYPVSLRVSHKRFTKDDIPDLEKLNNWHNVRKIYEVRKEMEDGFSVVVHISSLVPTFIDSISVSLEIPNEEDEDDIVSGQLDEVSQNVIDVEDQVDTNAADIIYLQENKQDISRVYSSYDFIEGNICGDIATDGNIHITENNKSNIFITYYVGDPGDTKNKVYIDIDYSTYNLDDSYYFMLLIKEYPHSQSFVDYAGNPIDSLNNYNWKADTLYYLLKDSYDNVNKTWSYKVIPVNSQDIDLSNYYDKDETYSQTEIDELLKNINSAVNLDSVFTDSDGCTTRDALVLNRLRLVNNDVLEDELVGYDGYTTSSEKENAVVRSFAQAFGNTYTMQLAWNYENENKYYLRSKNRTKDVWKDYVEILTTDKYKKITFLSTDFNSNELTITHNLATTDVDCVVINENNRRELCKLTIVDENNIKITNDRAFNGAIIINKI